MYLIKPSVGGEDYDPSQMVYFGNPKQSFVFAKYIKLYDVLVSSEGFTYVFKRDDARPLLEKWRNYDLK